MKYFLLASGSKGNACLVQTKGLNILIDCGTTKRYLLDSLADLSLTLDDIDALLITHDHSDHTRQIHLFDEHPVYSPTDLKIASFEVNSYDLFQLGHVEVLPLETSHDEENSVGYLLDDGNKRLIYMTDTGYVRQEDLIYMKDANFYILESNHDPTLLMKTKRPFYIKQRILSDSGHLSNDQAGKILQEVVGPSTQEIVLAHMSEEANDEDLAYRTVRSYVEDQSIDIRVARQFEVMSGGNYNEK